MYQNKFHWRRGAPLALPQKSAYNGAHLQRISFLLSHGERFPLSYIFSPRGGEVSLPKEVPVKKGAAFICWVENKGGVQYAPGEVVVPVLGDMVLLPLWGKGGAPLDSHAPSLEKKIKPQDAPTEKGDLPPEPLAGGSPAVLLGADESNQAPAPKSEGDAVFANLRQGPKAIGVHGQGPKVGEKAGSTLEKAFSQVEIPPIGAPAPFSFSVSMGGDVGGAPTSPSPQSVAPTSPSSHSGAPTSPILQDTPPLSPTSQALPPLENGLSAGEISGESLPQKAASVPLTGQDTPPLPSAAQALPPVGNGFSAGEISGESSPQMAAPIPLTGQDTPPLPSAAQALPPVGNGFSAGEISGESLPQKAAPIPLTGQDTPPLPSAAQALPPLENGFSAGEIFEESLSLASTPMAEGAARAILFVLFFQNSPGGPVSNMPLSFNFQSGQTIVLPTTVPICPGYTFTGWLSVGTNQVLQPGSILTPTETLYLNALWRRAAPDEFVITFLPNDRGGPPAQNMPQQMIVRGGMAQIPPIVPTRDDYQFLAWSWPDMGTSYQPGDLIRGIRANVQLFAVWRAAPPPVVTLTFLGNDSPQDPAQNLPPPIRQGAGSDFPIPATVPTRSGFLFSHWNTSPDGGGRSFAPGDVVEALRQDMELFAIWTALPPDLLVITFHPNDDGGPPASGIPAPIEVPAGGRVQLPSAMPTREGFTFVGWNTRPDGSGAIYHAGAFLSNLMGDLDLYAMWSPTPAKKHRIIFQGNDCGRPPYALGVPRPMVVLGGEHPALPAAQPTRDCFLFEGWNTCPGGGGRWFYPGQRVISLEKDLVLYAIWSYHVAGKAVAYFLDSCGTPLLDPLVFCVDEGPCLPLAVPKKEGFTFLGWGRVPWGGACYQGGQRLYHIGADVCLYAQWQCGG